MHRMNLFFPYLDSYKGFKTRYVKVLPVKDTPLTMDGEPIPWYWRLPNRVQGLSSKDLNVDDKVRLGILNQLPPGGDIFKKSGYNLSALMQRGKAAVETAPSVQKKLPFKPVQASPPLPGPIMKRKVASSSPKGEAKTTKPKSREHLGPKGASRPKPTLTLQGSTVVHEASVRCLSRSRRYMIRIWEAGTVGGDRSVQPTHSGGWKPQRLAIIGVPLSFFHWRLSWKVDHVRLRLAGTGNTHHFDNGGSMASRGRNKIAAADNQRFEGYIDGCGMCGFVGHSFNDCPILQEPPPLLRPQPVPSQAILSPQENISDISMRSDMELPQQQSLKVQYAFSGNPNSENSTTMLGFADSNSVANSMLAATNSTKMVEIDDYVPTIFDLDDVVKIANSMIDVTDLIDMTLDKILDQVTMVEIANPACADVDITNPMCADAKMACPRYANVGNAFADRAKDVDSLVDKSDNVNMTKSVDSKVEGLDLADKIAISDLADSRKQDEVTINSNIQEEAIAESNNLEGADSKSNNQEATKPNFGSRNCK
ncbi:hypothetical protein CR513_62823, partial [Mucuna pruriens]